MEQVTTIAEIESYTAKFKKELSIVIIALSYDSIRPIDVGKLIVDSVYCDHMTGMRVAFLTIETIPEQLVQDG